MISKLRRGGWSLRRIRISLLPTPRLCLYLGLGALLWVGAAFLPGLALAALFYPLLLLAVASVDALATPRARDFEFGRAVEERLNLGVANRVSIRVRRSVSSSSSAAASRAVELWVRDEAPDSWPLRGSLDPENRIPLLKLEAAPDEESQASYQVLPTRRGDWSFGGIHARLDSPLGLWRRWLSQDATQSVKVFPDVTAVARYEWMLRNGRSHEIGLHRLRLRGQGTEFESLRDYTPGDEFKSINWKASARRNKLISTSYEVERDQTIVLALDCGRMMTALALTRAPRSRPSLAPAQAGSGLNDFLNAQPEPGTPASTAAPGSGEAADDRVALSKLDCAINAGVLLAHVAASMGDAVGLLLFDDEVRAFLPPRKGRAHTGAIIEALYAVQPRLVEPDFAAAYAFLQGRKLRRSLIVTFTDVIDPFASQELVAAAASLRRSHNALCISISNRDVSDLAARFPLDLPEMFDKAMAQRLLWQRSAALENLRSRGVGVLDVDASALSAATVDRYLEMKARGAF